MQYPWPGNVRELQNAVERAVVVGSPPTIEPDDLPLAGREAGSGEFYGRHGGHAPTGEGPCQFPTGRIFNLLRME